MNTVVHKKSPFECLKGFTINFCSANPSGDYQKIEYTKNVPATKSTNPVQSSIQPIQTRLPRQSASTQLVNFKNYPINLAKPAYNSTQLSGDSDADDDSRSSSSSSMSLFSPETTRNKLTSTAYIHDTILTQPFDESALSQIDDTQSTQLPLMYPSLSVNMYFSSSGEDSSYQSADDSEQDSTVVSVARLVNLDSVEVDSLESQTVNSSFFDADNDEVFVCILPHTAQVNCEVSVEYADRVKILYEKENEVLVQNVVNGQSGYVPKCCLVPLDQFLNDIKQLASQRK